MNFSVKGLWGWVKNVTQILTYLCRRSDNVYCHHQDLCMNTKEMSNTTEQLFGWTCSCMCVLVRMYVSLYMLSLIHILCVCVFLYMFSVFVTILMRQHTIKLCNNQLLFSHNNLNLFWTITLFYYFKVQSQID